MAVSVGILKHDFKLRKYLMRISCPHTCSLQVDTIVDPVRKKKMKEKNLNHVARVFSFFGISNSRRDVSLVGTYLFIFVAPSQASSCVILLQRQVVDVISYLVKGSTLINFTSTLNRKFDDN